MSEYNILLPGGGGPAAIGAIKSLRMGKFNGTIISNDTNTLSAGLYLADRSYILPSAKNPKFLEEALNIIEKEKINIIFPTSGFDIVPYSKNIKKLKDRNVIPIISSAKSIDTCINKMAFYNKMKNNANLAFTSENINEIDFPCFIKPKTGKGSRNAFVCHNEKEFEFYSSKVNDLIIQEYLEGTEYTVDVLNDLNGNALFAVPRKRLEVKAGISTKGKIEMDRELIEECMKISEKMKIIGPAIIQFKRNKRGEAKVIEMDPRMGGGTYFATLAGFNIPLHLINLIEGKTFKEPKIKEITIVRYFNEIIVEEGQL